MIKKEDIFQFPNTKWALPFFASHTEFCFKYVDLLKNETGSYDFVHCVYGSPACKMNGGHAGRSINEEQYLNELNEWNKRGISVWVTFSNYLATLKDLIHDEQSINILERLEQNNQVYSVKNGVILASDTLVKFIRHQYSSLKLIASVVWFARENKPYSKELYNEKLNTFDVVCISYHHNDKTNDVIADFNDKSDNVEILINNICNLKCKMITKCYEWQSRKSLGLETGKGDDIVGPACPSTIYKNQNKLTPKEESTVLTYSQTKLLSEKGFILKLASRVYNINAFKAMIYGWMINIDYRDIIENVLYGLEDKELYPDE